MKALLLLSLTTFLCCTSPGHERSAKDFDVLILGATIHDGSGADPEVADIGIRGDRIAEIGELDGRSATRSIDARGLIACPGFIDLHNHGDNTAFQSAVRQNLSYLTQGCTTIVTGNCGGGVVDTKRYLDRLDKQGYGTNVCHLIPQGSLREVAMGGSFNRPPTVAELARMKQMVADGMRAGAFGISTGLIYTPGAYASTDELVALVKVAGEHGGIYASHIRDEGDELLLAVREAIAIGEAAGCPVHISHFKASKPPNWGKVKGSCQLVADARARGLMVTVDQYPYRASSTSLAALVIPTWAREGNNRALVARLEDPVVGKRIRAAVAKSLSQRGGADKILIARYAPRPEWNGSTLEAVAERVHQSPVDAVVAIQSEGGAAAVAFSMCDEDVEYVMRQPFVATASDGSSKVPGPSRPHPRSYGTFPRKIGVYALERGVVTLNQAIRSASGLPADILGLRDRGYVRKGFYADLVVFDPRRFRDRATFVDPHQYSVGAEWVFVNGTAAIAAGEPTGVLAGKALRSQ